MPKPEGEISTDDPGTAGAAGNSADGAQKSGENVQTFTQEQVNEIVQKRINEVNAKADERIQAAVKESLEQYKHEQGLSPEQKEKEQLEKSKSALAEKERELNIRDNRLKAQEILHEKGIPSELAPWFDGENFEDTKEKIDLFEKQFNKAVEEVVTKKLAGTNLKDPSAAGAPTGKRSTHDLLFKK